MLELKTAPDKKTRKCAALTKVRAALSTLRTAVEEYEATLNPGFDHEARLETSETEIEIVRLTEKLTCAVYSVE